MICFGFIRDMFLTRALFVLRFYTMQIAFLFNVRALQQIPLFCPLPKVFTSFLFVTTKKREGERKMRQIDNILKPRRDDSSSKARETRIRPLRRTVKKNDNDVRTVKVTVSSKSYTSHYKFPEEEIFRLLLFLHLPLLILLP